jgi:hypothetical protein
MAMEGSFSVESPIPNSGELITVSTTPIGLTPSKYTSKGTRTKNASSAFITVDVADLRFTFDGSTPVSGGNGHRIAFASNQGFVIKGPDSIRNFKAIREGSQDAKIMVTYFY